MKLLIAISVCLCFLLSSCSDSPRRQLSSDERAADMAWVFSKFDHNYAPVNYKEDLHSFNYEEVKESFLLRAREDQSNEDFFRLVHEFVAQFKDAHTSASLNVSPLPGRSRISYLGFKGVRSGNDLIVTSLLPTITNPNFPVKIGDVIRELNGVSLIDVIKEDLLPYINLGNEQANYTALMNTIFTRDLNHFLPAKSDTAEIGILRGKSIEVVELPWVVKDSADFASEQLSAIRAESSIKHLDLASMITEFSPFLSVGSLSYEKLIKIFLDNDKSKILSKILEYNSSISYLDTFEHFLHFDIWQKIDLAKEFYRFDETKINNQAKDEEDKNKKEEILPTSIPDRNFGLKNYSVEGATIFPAALVVKTSGEVKDRVGYIRIPSFSVASEDEAVIELKNSLQYFNDLGVNRLVIDLLDNGGGSLSLGTRLAQALTPEKIQGSGIQFKLNDNWLDSFENQSLSSGSDAEKEIAKRVLDNLLKESLQGKKISSTHDIESLFPFSLSPNKDIADKEGKSNFKIVLLVNEMCASMCDIFSALIQDNKLGKVFGQQSMGAGGNVTTHLQAPNSGFILQQTESLIIRGNGEFLENNGVKPDREYKTYLDINNKFRNTISSGVDYLLEI